MSGYYLRCYGGHIMRKRSSRADFEALPNENEVANMDFGISRRAAVWLVAFAAFMFALFLTSDFWLYRKPMDNKQQLTKGDGPFRVSSDDIIFETGDGVMLTLTPRTGLKETADVSIVLNDMSIINTISSFKVLANSTTTIQIPIHSRDVAGHCVMSFKTNSKQADLEKLFQLRIKIKVVHQILFGYLSIVIGWLYFVMWSCCYYPQIYRNWKRRSVIGFSFDYLALNITGHICYFTFNSCMFFNSSIQKSFTLIHPKAELPVKINDVFFSVHAVTMNIILLLECTFLEKGDQRISLPMTVLVGGLWVTISACTFGAIVEKLDWLQVVYYLSFIKVGTTPIKYMPQVYLHYRSKSTEGWAIQGVMLDAAGGILSFSQMAIEAINNDDWEGELGNPGKLGLSLIALVFCGVFTIQHFILYPQRKPSSYSRNANTASEQKEFHHKLQQLTESLVQDNSRKVKKIFDL